MMNRMFWLLLFTCVACDAQMNYQIVDRYQVVDGLAYFTSDSANDILSVSPLPDGSSTVRTIIFSNGAFESLARADLDSTEVTDLYREAWDSAQATYESVVDFRLSELEDESDPVLWKTVSIDDDQQLDILLVPNGTLFSSVVRNDEKEITFDYAFVQDIRTALVDGRELIIVHLVYCGAASCSSELVALY